MPGASAVKFVVLLVGILLLSAGPSTASTADASSDEHLSLRPSDTAKDGKRVVFSLKHVESERIAGALLSYRGRTTKVNAARVRRRAANDGRLRQPVPRRWLRKSQRRLRVARTVRLHVALGPSDPEAEGALPHRPEPSPDDQGQDHGGASDDPAAPPIVTGQIGSEGVEPDPGEQEGEQEAPDEEALGEPEPAPTPEPEVPQPEDESPEPTPQVTEPIPPSELKIGLVSNAQGWDMNAAHVLDQSAPTGTRWLREDMDWEVIEPRNDEWHWERYDNLFAEAAARGIRILPVLMSTPEWAGSAWNEIPANPAEFAEMAAQVAARYGPGGTYWEANPSIAGFAPEQFEIWNEPYLDYFSAGGVDAGRYARLVKAASQAAKKANPAAGIMLAADYSPSGKPSHTFIEDMYGAVPDLNEHFDSVAVHPYSGDSSPTDPRGGWGFPRIQTIRDKLVSFGGADKHLWITEIGWSTCPKPTGSYCVSESQQASYTAQLFELLQTKYSSYVDAVFLYRREDMNDNPSDKEGWFGMVRLDGSEKPVYDVFRRAVGAA